MAVSPRCEECGGAFEPLRGGICSSCGRLLCGRHLHGLLAQLWGPLGRAEPLCVRCRRRPDGPAGGEGLKPE